MSVSSDVFTFSSGARYTSTSYRYSDGGYVPASEYIRTYKYGFTSVKAYTYTVVYSFNSSTYLTTIQPKGSAPIVQTTVSTETHTTHMPFDVSASTDTSILTWSENTPS